VIKAPGGRLACPQSGIRRDRSTLFFTLLLPIALVGGHEFRVRGPGSRFKVGVIAAVIDKQAHPFLSERYVEFVPSPIRLQAFRR